MTTNTTKPLVSILMPFYNAGECFGAALQSILNQTYENWELLLCDDGSTDQSLALAKSIRDERVIVWSDGKRVGLAGRLNECIDRARGELFARMDSDDISYPARFQSQLEFLLARPDIDVVGCQMLILGEAGELLGRRTLPLEHEQIVAHPLAGFGLAHPTWMARGDWFRRYRYDLTAVRFEDVELLYRAYRTSRFANLPEILYGYREMRNGFSKRLKTRLGNMRYLNRKQEGAGRSIFYRAALAQAGKVVADALLAAFSLRYAMLKFKEARLTSGETDNWRDVYNSVRTQASGSALSPEPVQLMVITTVADTVESFFVRQIKFLAESGFHVHVVSSPGPGLDALRNVPAVTTHEIPMARKPDPLRDVPSLIQLFRLMRRIRPDIVHAHTPKAGLLGMMAATAARVRERLYTIHGLPLLTRQGAWRRVLEFAEWTSCALATRTYAVSSSLCDVVSEMKICRKEKISVLGDGSCAGIDVERFDASAEWTRRAAVVRSGNAIPADAIVVTFVGRIARDKGIAILASAWMELANQIPQLHLLMVGNEDSSDPVPAAVLQSLRDHKRVHFTGGWVSLDAMPAVYAASDIAVLPTFREGLGQVFLEAGAMRVPVVSTRVPGVVNAVRGGITGLLVPAGEAVPLAAAIRRLALDAGLRSELGNAARAHVCARFSEQRVNRLWLAEYRGLIHQATPLFIDNFEKVKPPR